MVKVQSFQTGSVSVDLEGASHITGAALAQRLGLGIEGTTWLVDGVRLSFEEIEEYRVMDGSTVRIQEKTDNGSV